MGGGTYPAELVIRQVGNLYGITDQEKEKIPTIQKEVFSRMEKSFQHIANKYYHNNGDTIFNPLHTAQYTMYLYFLANTLYRQASEEDCRLITDLCDKIYGLSKMLSSADMYYEVDLPEIFFFDHPQGSVLGRAKYGNFFSFSQGCTVGNNKGKYPEFGEHVHMFSGSKVLGNCKIGNRVLISANTYIKDVDIPSDSIVFGSGDNIVIRSITREKFKSICQNIFIM